MPFRGEARDCRRPFRNRIRCSPYSGGEVHPAATTPASPRRFRSWDLVLVCEAGTRAGIAQKSLSLRSGRVFVLDGGTRAWREAGLPLIALRGTHWSLERQVRLGAGVMILIGFILALLVSEVWLLVPLFVGAGLTFAGATDICMMGRLLARMPWNQLRNSEVQRTCNL